MNSAMPKQHGLGWIPDLPDRRDFLYALAAPTIAVLPPHVDLRPNCSPIEDQGSIGSCTAQACIGALEFLEKKDRVPFEDLSRLFVYYNERRLIGTTLWDSGAYLRDGMKTLAHDGVCPESTWPYRTWRYRCKPSRRAYSEGLTHQITEYRRILTVDEGRTCLAEGYPFVFGFSVYSSFMTGLVASTGEANMPIPGERMVGGHAVLAVGYDDPSSRFICRNSWGTRWGDSGYFTMPFAYLADRNLSDDFWTVRRGELI